MRKDPLFSHPVRFELPAGKRFLVWLSHDVDRVFKTLFHSVYYALKQRRMDHVSRHIAGHNPYWNFEKILDMERNLDVKSTFFFLNETLRPNWLKPKTLVLAKGRYRIDDPRIVDAMRRIDGEGWEIGVHGSYASFADRELLESEKRRLEELVGHPVEGIRQHYLNLSIPETWEIQRSLGFRHDHSYGSSGRVGFHDGAEEPFRPFQDEFVVFPLTIMDKALFENNRTREEAWDNCLHWVDVAEQRKTVLSLLWHQRSFSEQDFPGQGTLYERLIRECQRRSALFCTGRDIFEYIK